MTDTITDSERDLLRFPAIADVLRFGTPVRSNNPERTYKGQAVILSVDPGRQEARVAYARDIFPPEWVSLDDIALDLTDATGRAHLAWWVARYFLSADGPPTPGCYMQVTSSLWSFDGGAWILALLAQPERHMRGHRLTPVGATETFEFPAHGKQRHEYGVPVGWHWSSVPALATLDPNDPRLLPDGSRLVDALALSMVGRHLLAGGDR